MGLTQKSSSGFFGLGFFVPTLVYTPETGPARVVYDCDFRLRTTDTAVSDRRANEWIRARPISTAVVENRDQSSLRAIA